LIKRRGKEGWNLLGPLFISAEKRIYFLFPFFKEEMGEKLINSYRSPPPLPFYDIERGWLPSPLENSYPIFRSKKS